MAFDIKRIAAIIASEIGARPGQAAAAIALLDEGATVPFVARYRKEVTGGLDDTQLRLLAERLDYLRELDRSRDTILAAIREQGKLTDELEAQDRRRADQGGAGGHLSPLQAEAADARPRSRASAASDHWRRRSSPTARQCRLDLAAAYVTDDVPDAKAALEGAREILSEQLAENADLVGRLRTYMKERAFLRARVVEGKQEAGAKFSDYFDHVERWSEVPSHRALAMLRGRNEDVLSLEIEVDADDASPVKPVVRMIAEAYAIGAALPGDRWLMEVVGWTWRVKLSLHLALDLMRDLRERAEEEAIQVFARNLKDLLLAAPAGSRATMGLDPGIRTGVKVAVVDGTGKLLGDEHRLPLPAEERCARHRGRACRA